MLKVSNKGGSGMKAMANLTPKKRGRPAKVRPSTLETMKANNDPDIRHLRDLYVSDRTEILEGKSPDFVHRWVEESQLRTRQYQGYEKETDPKVRTHFDGNYMPAEGYDRRMVNKGGLVLCKIRKDLYEKRQAVKAEKVAQQSQAMEAQHISEMQQAGGAILSANDPFVGGLANGD